jgi:hypothetical protein
MFFSRLGFYDTKSFLIEGSLFIFEELNYLHGI